MRRKKLLTAVLCTVLAMASCSVSSVTNQNIKQKDNKMAFVVHAQEGEGSSSDGKEAEIAPLAETNPPQTDPPQTDPPQTDPPQTNPPQTNPPQTETNPPQTDPPQTSGGETNPPQTSGDQTNPPETSGGSEGSSESEPSTSSSESSTENLTEGQTPSETMPESETSLATESQTGEGKETELSSETAKEKEKKESEEKESETSKYKSNRELIAHQNIVVPPDIQLEFRFTKVEARYGVVSNPEGAPVYEEKSEESRTVGELEYYGSCYLLDDKDDGWYYVESGNVRGFVKAEDIVSDDVAQRIVNVKGLDELPAARLLVARTENEAFDYTHTTVQEVMADKEYAVAKGEVQIYEQRKESAAVTGVLPDQGLCYILADEENDWVFVESGDVRGFVLKSKLLTGRAASDQVDKKGENNMQLASLRIQPEDNKACYYTLTSVKEASQESKTREAMVNFALQFVGNPYVWGGTSLTGGADCSGFVQSIYAYFGYSLPRVAEAQAGYGMQIPVSSAKPGDLIFYAKNGYVYHVSMYIGNGRVVQAANKNVGIITSGIAGDAVWATRIING